MFDSQARRALEQPLDRVAGWLDRAKVTPDRITMAGLVLGVLSAVSAAGRLWWLALILWLLSRFADGLDGPLARRRVRAGGVESLAGGFLDIVADFVAYGATVVGVAVGVGGPWWPFALVLLTYYINGSSFLAFSSLAERSGRRLDDGRSFSFIGGLAEGGETVVVHALWIVLPSHAAAIAVVWAAVVALSATQRTVAGYRLLR